jgi:hypothetical protein
MAAGPAVNGQLPGVVRVPDRGLFADAEGLGRVQRVEPGGYGLGELAPDPQPLEPLAKDLVGGALVSRNVRG